MRRRRRLDGDHEDSTRWLVSYADLVTLLFAFFVVMYAVSSVNDAKYRVVADAMQDAFGKVPPPAAASVPPASSANPLAALPLQALRRELQTLLAPRLDGGQVQLREDATGLHLAIHSQMLFAPGDARLRDDAVPMLRVIAEVLAGEPFDLEVAGHTDNQPIHTVRFASNWELSALRATAVLAVLADAGIASARLKAVGRADSQPVATNLTPQGRSANRRVELTIVARLPPLAR